MREIKFRAVDGNRLVASVGFTDSDLGRSLWEEAYMVGGGGQLSDDAILLQYTGLKDKNGIEIYEGDILAYTDLGEVKSKFRGEAPNSNWGGIVEYINDGEGVGTIGRFGVKGLMWKPQVCEVIGNIYENPELLK